MLGSVTAEWQCNMKNSSSEGERRGRSRPKGLDKASDQGRRVAAQSAAMRPAMPELQLSGPEEEGRLRAHVRAMVGRDQAALGKLYDATCARVHGVVLRIVRRPDLAEEVLADVYFQAWRECHRYDVGRGKVIAWLLIIGRSRSLDALRRADEAFSHPAPEDLMAAEEVLSFDDDPLGLLDTMRGNEAIQRALESLSAVQRQLVALAFFKGLSHAEIATHTKLPLGSVKTHIRKALLQLRDVLACDETDH